MNKTITAEQIEQWLRNGESVKKRIVATDNNWPKSPLEIIGLESITIHEKLTILLRPEIIPEKQLHLLACGFAEHVLPIYEAWLNNHKHPLETIKTKRKYAESNATHVELEKNKDNTWATYAALMVVISAEHATSNYWALVATGEIGSYAAYHSARAAAEAAFRSEPDAWHSHSPIADKARESEEQWQLNIVHELLLKKEEL